MYKNRCQIALLYKAPTPRYKNIPYSADLGINAMTWNETNAININNDCPSAEYRCSSTYDIRSLVMLSSSYRIRVANACVCSGACGIKPLPGGRPKIAHGIIVIPKQKKSQ